jgi:hypothetical protein
LAFDGSRKAVEHTAAPLQGLFGEEQREKIENALLATTGVLSFWFDIHQQKAEIRARIDEKSVIAAIKTSGFTAIAWRGEGSPHAAVKVVRGVRAARVGAHLCHRRMRQ